MITREKINAASNTLNDIDVESLIAVIRVSARYKTNPAYFTNLAEKFLATNGTVKAQQLNAVLDAIEALGIGQIEINQSQTVGTDGLVYSQVAEREALIDYALNVVYEEFFESSTGEDNEAILILKGKYGVGRLPLDYQGYL